MKNVKQDDPFRAIYSSKVKQEKKSAISKTEEPALTLSAYKMPLGNFCRILSDKFNIGIVFADSLTDKIVSAEFKSTDLTSVLNVLSRQLQVDVVRVGNTYFIGSLRPEDRGVLVRSVLGYSDSSLDNIVKSMLSEKGKCFVFQSIVAVTDHESVLRRVAEMLDYLDSQEFDTWIVQTCFVVLKKDALLEAGFDVTSSGSIAYNISQNKVELNDFKIEGLFNGNASSSYADIYASPMVLVRDGSSAVWKDGKKVPVPKKSVSQYGTVQTTGFDYVETGFSVDLSVNRSKRGGILKMSLTMSDIDGYVEECPRTTQSVYTFETDLEPEKIYLVGELNTFKVLDSQRKSLLFSTDRGKAVLQIWVKLYRVEGSSKEKFNRFNSK